MTGYCRTVGCARRWANQISRAAAPRCRSCRAPLAPLKRVAIGTMPFVLKEFPEHYNWSMGCVVKNRAHHRQLQRERGLQDWIPVRESPMLSKLRRQGHRI